MKIPLWYGAAEKLANTKEQFILVLLRSVNKTWISYCHLTRKEAHSIPWNSKLAFASLSIFQVFIFFTSLFCLLLSKCIYQVFYHIWQSVKRRNSTYLLVVSLVSSLVATLWSRQRCCCSPLMEKFPFIATTGLSRYVWAHWLEETWKGGSPTFWDQGCYR